MNSFDERELRYVRLGTSLEKSSSTGVAGMTCRRLKSDFTALYPSIARRRSMQWL